MSAGRKLEQYLTEVRQRLQAAIVARASAIVAVTALVITVATVLVLRNPGFPADAVLIARVVLVTALVTAAIAALWQPLNALRPRNRSRTLERHLPAQRGRIETYLELTRRRDEGHATPLIELLAEDALAVAEQTPVDTAIPRRRIWIPAALALAGVAALAALLIFGQAEWGFGSRNLWFGTPIPREQVALRQIRVTPGDATVRRNQDLPIRAMLRGFRSDRAEIFVRFGDAKKWERAPMRAVENGEFEFTLYALREPATYYVASNGTRSALYRVGVVEAPRIARMRLTYNYPSWTGLKPETDETNRDIRAVAGTRVTVEVQTTAPLESPTLTLDDSPSPLESDGTWARGTLEVKKPGHYRVSARVGDEVVPLTDEHEISIIEDQPPTIEFARPARDWQASSIEEVPIEVHAKDDFRVQRMELHYSVNGGPWQVAPLRAGGKDVTGDIVLRLEDIGARYAKNGPTRDAGGHGETLLQPGDLVTYFAVAKDRKQAVQTDLFLIHVQPFERRFMQGQAGGMQGGGEDQQNIISQRQREILLATWNLKRQRERPEQRELERLQQNARMLSEAQGTLAEQARTLIERAAARGVDSADPKNHELIEQLEQAAEAMQPAAKDLANIRLAEAIPSEQKALQHLLRAEALYTDIEVQFRNAMARGGNAGQAGRDLAEMFELEMDLDKNQYETQSRAMGENSPRQLEETLRKLRELARRQERLARETAHQPQLRESDRWKQEQLKRETEELRQRLADLARQSADSPSSQGRGQGQSSLASTAAEALNQIERALENMEKESRSQSTPSAGSGQSARNARSAQLASRDLQQALKKLEQGRREGMVSEFEDLARRAEDMLEAQRRSESELLNVYSQASALGSAGPGRPRGLTWDRAEALAEAKRSLRSQVDSLQRDMQAAAQQHREDAPDASKRLGTAARDLAESNLSAGLARSALELERGRALQAAAREQLITAALENLQNDLSQAATVAANEAREPRSGPDEASPEELLAELAELRRAWELAQANAQGRPPGVSDPRGAPSSPSGQRNPDDASRGDERNNDASGGEHKQDSGHGSETPSDGGKSSHPGQPGSRSGSDTRYAYGGATIGEDDWGARGPSFGGHANDRGLRAWHPPVSSNTLRAWRNSPEFREQAEEIARRLRELMNRMPRDALAPADVSALRQLASRLRHSSRDPMESEYQKMVSLVDQLELAALNASEKARNTKRTHTANPAPDSPEYREAVSEYYRRLGGTR